MEKNKIQYFELKKFRVDLTRIETGKVWKRDHPTQIFDSLEDAEKEARRWDNFYKRDYIIIGDIDDSRRGIQHVDTCQRIFSAEVIHM